MYWTVLSYHPYLVSMFFADLLSLHLVTFLMFSFILVHVTFFSSRCMLELKFDIYHRAASLPSPASYAVLAEESQAFFKHSPHTNSISNSAILHNNYISWLSDLCACVHVKKKWHRKGSHSSSVSGSNRLVWLQTWKKRWAGALLSVKCCCFVQTTLWKSHANLN